MRAGSSTTPPSPHRAAPNGAVSQTGRGATPTAEGTRLASPSGLGSREWRAYSARGLPPPNGAILGQPCPDRSLSASAGLLARGLVPSVGESQCCDKRSAPGPHRASGILPPIPPPERRARAPPKGADSTAQSPHSRNLLPTSAGPAFGPVPAADPSSRTVAAAWFSGKRLHDRKRNRTTKARDGLQPVAAS